MRNYNIESDLKQEQFQTLKLVQGDRGNKIKINVYEDGQPVSLTGCSVTAKYKRADGEIINDGVIENIHDNSFDAVMDSSITKVAGTLKMLFTIEKDAVKVSAFLLLADVREGIGESSSSGGSAGGGEVKVDLTDYYKKIETYSRKEIDAQFKDIAKKTITTEERAKLNSLENYDDTSVKNDIQTQKSRIDTFTTLQEGSTTGDAELIDARVGANGVAYNNVGNAIRTQIKWITSDIDKIKELKLVGKNKFDKTQQKDGYYYTSKGVLKELEGWAISDKIEANKGDILYLEVFNNMSAVHISEWDKYDNFLTWQNISTTSLNANKLSDGWYYPYSIANDNCAYIIIDIETSKNSLIQIEKNTLTGTYEEYYWYFENNTYKQLLEIIEKVNIIEKNSIDYSIFTLPYIRERKVLCNTKVNYASIDVGEKIDRIDCKYIWERGENSGTLALIFTNKPYSILDITCVPSIHFTISNTHIALDIFGAYDSTGSNAYQRIFEYDITEQPLDGETEHTVLFYLSKNSTGQYTGKINVTIDGTNYSGNIDTSIEPFVSVISNGIDGMNLQSAWFEHFTTEKDRNTICMPMITYFATQKYVNGKWTLTSVDMFDRQDGQLTCDAYGHNYILINSTTKYKR